MIIDYLNTLSKQAALKYYDMLIEQIASLSVMPERCPRPRDLALAAKGYRCLIVKDYLVFYMVVGDTASCMAAATIVRFFDRKGVLKNQYLHQ